MQEISIQELREAFDEWRQSRPHRQFVPAHLKEMAVLALNTHPVSKVKATTKISKSSLYNWRPVKKDGTLNQTISQGESFYVPGTPPNIQQFISLDTKDEDQLRSDKTEQQVPVSITNAASEMVVRLSNNIEVSLKGYNVEQSVQLVLNLAKVVR